MSNPQLIVFVNFLARTREVRNSQVIYLFHILSEKFFKVYETGLRKWTIDLLSVIAAMITWNHLVKKIKHKTNKRL